MVVYPGWYHTITWFCAAMVYIPWVDCASFVCHAVSFYVLTNEQGCCNPQTIGLHCFPLCATVFVDSVKHLVCIQDKYAVSSPWSFQTTSVQGYQLCNGHCIVHSTSHVYKMRTGHHCTVTSHTNTLTCECWKRHIIDCTHTVHFPVPEIKPQIPTNQLLEKNTAYMSSYFCQGGR